MENIVELEVVLDDNKFHIQTKTWNKVQWELLQQEQAMKETREEKR